MRPKLLIINLLGIALLYAVSFWLGQQIKGEPAVRMAELDVKYSAIILEAAAQHDLHPALIAAVIHAESNFNPRARSYMNAKGLMQINPPTQRYLHLRNPFDPAQNVEAGTRYLKELLGKFNGNVIHALAAYNAGPGNVRKYAGMPPFRETKKYVKKVMAFYKTYRAAFDGQAYMS